MLFKKNILYLFFKTIFQFVYLKILKFVRYIYLTTKNKFKIYREKPDKIHAIAEFLQNWRKLLTEAILILFFLSVTIALFFRIREDKIIVEPFEVPPKLVEQGYTKDTFASALRNEMNNISRNAIFKLKSNEVIGKSPDSQVKVEVGGIGLSFESIIQEIKSFFGHHDIKIKGEVFYDNKQVVIIVRNNDHEIYRKKKSIEALDSMMKDMAESVEKSINPHILVLYYYNQKRPENEIEELRTYIFKNGTNEQKAYNHLLQGVIFYDKRQFNQAMEECKMATEYKPDMPQVYNIWGLALEYLHRYDEAIEKYKYTIQLDPEYAAAYSNWGNVLNSLKRYDEAIEKYKKAIKIYPEYANAYIYWGITLTNLKRYDEAIEKYKNSIKIYPQNVNAYSNWGDVLIDAKRYDEAIEKYKKAIQIDPEDAITYNNWGLALESLQHYDEAIEKYKKAIKINPENADAYNNWGVVLDSLRRYDEAIEKYKKAIQINPEYANAYVYWGITLKNLKRYDEAIEKFKKAIQINSENAVACYNLGESLESLNRYQDALVQYKRYLKLEKNKEDRDAAKGKIAELERLLQTTAKEITKK